MYTGSIRIEYPYLILTYRKQNFNTELCKKRKSVMENEIRKRKSECRKSRFLSINTTKIRNHTAVRRQKK